MLKGLLFTSEEIENIKNSDCENVQSLYKTIMDSAKTAVENESSADVEMMGFAYHSTGDIKYFNKVKADIMALCEEECWTPGGLHGGFFSGKSELISARKTIYAAYVYELFGDLFTAEENEKIIKNTYEKGIKYIYEDWVKHETRIHALDTMGHNWWIVMVSSGALAASILKDVIPEGEEIARVSADCCKAWFEYAGNPINAKPVNNDNGAFWEGYSYQNYALLEYTKYAIVYKKIFGESPFDDKELLKQITKFLLSVYYPTDHEDFFINYGDAGFGTDPLECVYYFLRYGVDLPEARWYVNNANNQEKCKILRILLTDELKKENKAPEELNFCYDKIGWAIFRDGYEKNGKLFSVKCGDTWNHAHADAGHFVFYKNGVKEIFDGGGAQNYSVKSYQGYYVQSISHNTVLFNGKGQDYRDNYKDHAKIPGKLINFTEKDGFRYVMADCTGPMSRYFRKHHRHFLLLDKFILIYDDIECYEKGKVNFLLHAEEKNSFKMLTPCKKRDVDGYRDKSDEINCKYTSFDLETDEDAHAKFVSVICVDDSAYPKYEEFEKYVKVTCGDTVTYINLFSDGRIMHNNCIYQADGYITDAIILIEQDEKIGVINGSIVRRNGTTILGKWERINGYIK